jgi:undecaprenol kinase
MHKHHISFKHALDGFIIALKTQPNFRIHLFISLIAVILGFITNISPIEWGIIFLIISLGLSIELINTAIEFTVDLLTDQHHILAKYAKDTAAAAMLIFAAGSIVIGSFIFLPKLWLFI